MMTDYTVYTPGREIMLQLAFMEAGLSGLHPYTGPVGPGVAATILRGIFEDTYHFEAGTSNGKLMADPWEHELTQYNPYEVYYGVYW
jgi:hypothetical protein